MAPASIEGPSKEGDQQASSTVNMAALELDTHCPYSILPSILFQMNSDKDMDRLNKVGGAGGLAKGLVTDLHAGLNESPAAAAADGLATAAASELGSVEAHRKAYGENKFPEKPPPNFFMMLLEAAKDPMIIILLIVAIVTIVLGAAVPEQRAHQGWSEGLAVLGTALIVIFLGQWRAGQDFSKERQFQKLNALKDVIDVKVTRGGKQVLVPNTEVVVGDIMFLDTGDKVIADGIVIDSQGLVLDEASLTGESDPIKKDPVSDPWVRSGTTVNEGSGHMLVLAVGVHSEWGKTMALVNEAGDDETPLQEQLTDVAAKVSKMGVLVAVVCFLALLIKWLIVTGGGDIDKINDNGPLQFLLYAITITVVSIPEGLPLAVTLTLAYSMKKMMKDNNFVRVLSACETMGGATAICSDKTGTLTENRMTVVEGWFAGTAYPQVPEGSVLGPQVLELLKWNCAMNNKAFLESGVTDFVGNRTECALLVLLRKLGFDYKQLREEREADQIKLYGFSSARKMASVLLRERAAGGNLRLYNKGAAEWVLRRCVGLARPDGSTEPMTPAKLEEMNALVTGMAKRGLRCICLSYRDYAGSDPARPADFFEDADQVDRDLIAVAIVGIKDPVRKEVPDAVATCQKAGIVVRMVTGDNIHTAQHIARECGLLTTEDAIAMEGPVFRAMPATELIPLLPRLRVLARSSPEDKLTLVSLLKKQGERCLGSVDGIAGEIVAVTGDGTNDAPALKESDVGLAMGIAGTEVAKEAADIIILDDNFSSIVKSVLWGRAVYMNIRKFLVFQLSINLVAMISAAVGALYGGVPPLNVLQLLWVNMIMDTLAALALATEDPYPELLDDKPHGRSEAIITGLMYTHIVVAALYKLFWLFACLYGLPRVLPAYATLTKGEYYQTMCPEILNDKGVLSTNATLQGDVCNIMGFCGFPQGDIHSDLCVLHNEWLAINTTVPSLQQDAVCNGQFSPTANFSGVVAPGEACVRNTNLESAQRAMDDEWDREYLLSYKPALSVLFNAFILAQVANAFVSRRIGLELNFFKGLAHSPIFNGIMVLITALQVLIMQTPISYIFKVEPLNGPEWGACIAIGIGAIPFSWALRILLRWLLPLTANSSHWLAGLRGSRASNITASGAGPMRQAARTRTLSGGAASANHNRTASGRTLSGPNGGHQDHHRAMSGNPHVVISTQYQGH
eukprot:XP_001692057.1 plasma membrane calcium-transporting ATPase [Chlamydomonas reinhardtii]